MQPLDDLPPLLAQIADVAGLDAALMMAREFGGRQIYLPQCVMADHQLAQLLGVNRARKICAALGHGKVVIPLGPNAAAGVKRRKIAELLKQGLSYNNIAKDLSVHIRTVEKIAARLKIHDRRQSKLI